MTQRILKGDTAGVRPFLMSSATDAPQVADHGEAPSPMAALEHRLAAYESEIAAHQAALDEAYAKGELAGRIAAEVEFEEDRTQALADLADGLATARDTLHAALKRFDTLALEAAYAALQLLVGEHEHYREILKLAIDRQARALEGSLIQSVTVSRADFPDSREVAALDLGMTQPPVTVQVSDTLEAGQCIFQLQLGTVEFDYQWSWSQIAEILVPGHSSDGRPL